MNGVCFVSVSIELAAELKIQILNEQGKSECKPYCDHFHKHVWHPIWYRAFMHTIAQWREWFRVFGFDWTERGYAIRWVGIVFVVCLLILSDSIWWIGHWFCYKAAHLLFAHNICHLSLWIDKHWFRKRLQTKPMCVQFWIGFNTALPFYWFRSEWVVKSKSISSEFNYLRHSKNNYSIFGCCEATVPLKRRQCWQFTVFKLNSGRYNSIEFACTKCYLSIDLLSGSVCKRIVKFSCKNGSSFFSANFAPKWTQLERKFIMVHFLCLNCFCRKNQNEMSFFFWIDNMNKNWCARQIKK